MQCKGCGYPDSHVVYTKPVSRDNKIERRRECLRCGLRFTTHEKIKESKSIEDRYPHGNVK